MGKKYIIELLDDCPSEFKGIIVFGLTPEGQISAEPIPVEDLTPYTEPDLEQVRKEAYDDGFKNAVHNCPEGCPYVEHARNEAYQRGYEQGYKDGYNEPGKGKIQVGDEVFYGNTKGIVIRPEDGDRYASVFTAIGEHISAENKDLTKTGRHFPELVEVLQKMKETSNG